MSEKKDKDEKSNKRSWNNFSFGSKYQKVIEGNKKDEKPTEKG